MNPLDFHTIAGTILDEVQDRLSSESIAGPPSRAGIVPGQIAWDDCDCGGQLAVSIGSTFYSETFPDPWASVSPCPPTVLVSDLTIQIIRCAPSSSENGLPPTVAALDQSSKEITSDGFHVLQGTMCALVMMSEKDMVSDFMLGTLVYMGPEGGCVGSELHLFVGIDH